MNLTPLAILWLIRAALFAIVLFLGAFLFVFAAAVVTIERLSETLEGKRRFKKNSSCF